MNHNTATLPKPNHRDSQSFSVIWIIPIISLLVGGWLAYKTISERGPEILIIFDAVEGIEEGLTKIKFKEVNVGKVTDISLNTDLSKVHIKARLTRSMSAHLSSDSQFWIVKPRISSSGVSGLNTLISGIHIAFSPGTSKDSSKVFYGLSDTPEIHANAKGTQIILNAKSLGSLDRGSPVYFRKIQVGEVIQYSLTSEGQNVEVKLFIKRPYDSLITSNTRFWNASGVNLNINSSGISANIESLTSLVSGGIAFETPIDLNTSADKNVLRKVYTLHSKYKDAVAKPFLHKLHFVMYFDKSLRGLTKGANVEFRGIIVGKVLDIGIELNQDTLEVRAPVLVELHPEALTDFDKLNNKEHVIEKWIKRGLKAKLSTSNLLTGSLYIDLSFEKVDGNDKKILLAGDIPIFPTIEATYDRLTDSATRTIEKLAKMPLLEISEQLLITTKRINEMTDQSNPKSTVSNFNYLLRDINNLTTTANESLPSITKSLEISMINLNRTLDNTQGLVANDSKLVLNTQELIRSLSSAARSFESLTSYLERNPSALLYGKGN